MSREYTFRDSKGESRIIKLAVEELTFCFDFGPRLGVGETLASDPGTAITKLDTGSSDLTASSVAINSSEFTDDTDSTRTVVANEGVELKLSGGTAGAQYDLVVYATDSDGDIKAGRVRVDVI